MVGTESSGRRPSPAVGVSEKHTSITLPAAIHRTLSIYVLDHPGLRMNDLFLKWVKEGMRRDKIAPPKE